MPEQVADFLDERTASEKAAQKAAAESAAAKEASVQEENKKLREKLDEQSEQLIALKEERLAMLEAKRQPTEKESAEIYTTRQQIDEIKRNPNAKAWVELIREEARQLAKEEVSGTTFEEHRLEAMDWVEAKEKELGLNGTLQKELLEILQGGRWGDQDPRRRVRLAFLEWNRIDELKKKAEGSTMTPPHSEGVGKGTPPPTGFRDELKKSTETGNWAKTLDTLAEDQRQRFR